MMCGLHLLIGSSVLYALINRIDAIRVAKLQQRQQQCQQQCQQHHPSSSILSHRPYTHYLASQCGCSLNSLCSTSSTLLPPLPITFSLLHTVGPMVGQSDHTFRMLTRKYGATCVYTPMLYSMMFHDQEYRERVIDFDTRRYKTAVNDRPLIVQFAANHPETALRAAQHVEHMVDAIDINLGCPQDRARIGQYGSFLLNRKSWSLVSSIITTLRRHLSIPITCKIRLLSSFSETLEFCLLLHASGCSLITIHGRKQGSSTHRRSGLADLDMIRCIRLELTDRGINIPIISNGNIRYHSDILSNLKYTQCQGIMSVEAVLANPRLFEKQEESENEKKEDDGMRQIEMAREYLHFCHAHTPYPPLHWISDHIHNILRTLLSHHIDLKLQLKCIGREKKEYVCDMKPEKMSMEQMLDGIRKIEEVIEEVEKRMKKIHVETTADSASASAGSDSSANSSSASAVSNYRRQQRQADKLLAETQSDVAIDADDMTDLFRA